MLFVPKIPTPKCCRELSVGCSERRKTINRMPPYPIVNPVVQSFPVFRNNTSTLSRPYTCVVRASFLLQAGNVVSIVKSLGVPPLDMRKAVAMLSTSIRHYECYHLDVNIRVAEHTTQSCLFPFRGLTAAWFFELFFGSIQPRKVGLVASFCSFYPPKNKINDVSVGK